MTYLVTGGTGFIGSRIVRDIVREGEQVIVYDLFPEGSFLWRLLSEEEKTSVKIVRGNVTDLPYLIHTVKENKVEKIIHLASVLIEVSSDNPPLALKVNCEGAMNVFETARLLGLSKVVWASSITVFGSQEKYGGEPVANDAPQYPDGIYGACKAFNENVAAHYFEKYGVDISAIRYSSVYGFGRYWGSYIVTQELIEKPAVGEPGRVPFSDSTMNWLYVDDAARATLLAAKAARTKTRAFNISGDIRSVREVADYVRKLLPGADITLLPGFRGRASQYDTTRIEEELGFHPRWSMEEGVKQTINTVRQQYSLPPV